MWELQSYYLSQVNCTRSYALDTTVSLYFYTGWLAYLDREAFGADKGEEACAYYGFKDRDDEECEDVDDDQAEEAGSATGPEPGWG